MIPSICQVVSLHNETFPLGCIVLSFGGNTHLSACSCSLGQFSASIYSLRLLLAHQLSSLVVFGGNLKLSCTTPITLLSALPGPPACQFQPQHPSTHRFTGSSCVNHQSFHHEKHLKHLMDSFLFLSPLLILKKNLNTFLTTVTSFLLLLSHIALCQNVRACFFRLMYYFKRINVPTVASGGPSRSAMSSPLTSTFSERYIFP